MDLQGAKSALYPPDASNALFQLCPAGKHSASEKLRYLIAQIDTDADVVLSEVRDEGGGIL